MSDLKLTHFSHGAGCGCKIAPAVLETILQTDFRKSVYPNLLVGNESKDDAAVYDMGNNMGIISTTDFFMPIVDDPATFGRIASVNAISDVYAMGGKPLMALAVLGWPIGKIPAEAAREVLDGSRAVCDEAGIPLAGGHSIDSPEPIFGLAVTGMVPLSQIKKNNTATPGDSLYLTKPIGVGMVTTAHKRGVAIAEDFEEAVRVMTTLNKLGASLGALPYVSAMTDVTGFGLLGHLWEVCEGSNVAATVQYNRVPRLTNLAHYASSMIYPDNTFRNWSSYEKHVEGIGSESLLTLCDPQTSGGLLICVKEGHTQEFEALAATNGFALEPFGVLQAGAPRIVIEH